MKNMDLRSGFYFSWKFLVLSCSIQFFTNAQIFGPPSVMSPMIMPRGIGGVNPPGAMPGPGFPGSFGAPTDLGGFGAIDSSLAVDPSSFQIQGLQQRLAAFNNRDSNGNQQGNRNTVLSQTGNRVNAMSTEAANRFVDLARNGNNAQSNFGQPDTPEIDFNRISDFRSRFGMPTGQHLVHQLSTPPEEGGQAFTNTDNNNGGNGNQRFDNSNRNGGNFQNGDSFGLDFNNQWARPDNNMMLQTFEDPRMLFERNQQVNSGPGRTDQRSEQFGSQNNNNMNQNDVLRLVLGENSLPTRLFANAGNQGPMGGPLGMNMGPPGLEAMPPGMGNMNIGW